MNWQIVSSELMTLRKMKFFLQFALSMLSFKELIKQFVYHQVTTFTLQKGFSCALFSSSDIKIAFYTFQYDAIFSGIELINLEHNSETLS